MILARNDSCLGELDKLEPSRVDLHVSNNVKSVFFLDLMKASKKWKLEALLMDCFKEMWMTLAHISNRVAKCHGYGGYIRVKRLEGWGKESGRIHSFGKSSIVLGKFEQLI